MGKVIRWLDTAVMGVAALAVLVMMVIVSYDAISRYVFNAPLIWAFEIIAYYLLGFALYFAVSPTFSNGDHISIDMFRAMFPVRLRDWLDVLWCLLAAAAFAAIAYAAWHELQVTAARRRFFPGLLRWPAWISYVPIVVGCSVVTLRLTFHAFILAVYGSKSGAAILGEGNE